MTSNIRSFIFIAVCLGLVSSFAGCDTDKGLEPLNTGISGKITYLSPELRPNDVGEVRLAALLKFPPAGLGDLFFSEPIDFRQDTSEYFLPLPPDDYQAVALLWRRNNENWSFNSILGLYGLNPQDGGVDLLPVSVPDNNEEVPGIDMTALWNFAGADAKVQGTISVSGTPPSDTEAVLVATFVITPDFDDFSTSILFLGGIPLPVTPGRSTINYTMNVYSGSYQFLGLFWKGSSIPLEEMKCIGWYQLPGGSGDPGNVTVPRDGITRDIDFSADYGLLPNGIRP